MSGRIILVHGPSSSGKSTLCRALQDALDEPFWHYSIDHLRDGGVLPLARIQRGEFSWPDLREAFFEGFHRSVAAFAGAGNDLIVEHIVENDDSLARSTASPPTTSSWTAPRRCRTTSSVSSPPGGRGRGRAVSGRGSPDPAG